VVVGGFPHIPGKTMMEKLNHVKEHYDDLVTGILWEPRGHDDMFVAIVTPPTSPGADLGIIYRGAYDYMTMCGHGTIGAVTVAVETGLVKAQEPITTVKVDTPSGVVTTKAKIEGGAVKSVTIRNVPSFLYKRDVVVEAPGVGRVTGDLCYGGDFYFILDSAELGLDLDGVDIDDLIEISGKVKRSVVEQNTVQHPEIREIRELHGVIVTGPPRHPEASCRNLFISGTHIDRSPCGTGTCAKMASLYGRGKLRLHDEFVAESILGSIYRGTIVGETEVGGLTAIILELTGQAWIMGFNTLLIDPQDPFKYGFRLREKLIKAASR
jgi:proline racemase/trans-L-3-hydroxyproline dehydratase